MYANYHTHTARCGHASGEDREYVEAAIEAGYKVLGFSDHCPWIYPDSFVSGMRIQPSETEDYFDSILGLRREYRDDIRILVGLETEHMPWLVPAQTEFLSAYPLDYMILGQHFTGAENNTNYAGRKTASREQLTKYVDLCVEGMKSGRYLYLAHPDLIYYTGDTGIYEHEMRRLCREMKSLDIPLEMNILGITDHRNYPDKRFWKIARETGCRVILGVDAHMPEQLFCQGAAARAEQLCDGMELVSELI